MCEYLTDLAGCFILHRAHAYLARSVPTSHAATTTTIIALINLMLRKITQKHTRPNYLKKLVNGLDCLVRLIDEAHKTLDESASENSVVFPGLQLLCQK